MNTEDEECICCCESYNKANREKIICEMGSCDFNACKKCTRKYILTNSLEAHCMSCKERWSRKFMMDNLNVSFVEKDYAEHMRKVLLEREKALLPDTMPFVETHVLCTEEQNKIIIHKKELEELKNKIYFINEQIHTCNQNIIRINHTGCKDKKKFIFGCQYPNCRGFLSTQYKCEVCKNSTCSKCFNIMDHDEHVCKKEDIDSAQFIKKDTHPCPGCGERIHKIDGCDQMWCPTCHTAFDWKTGGFIKGRIHNPEYFRWQQEHNIKLTREPQDVICGGLCQFFLFKQRVMKRISSKQDEHLIQSIYQRIADITYDRIPVLRENVRRFEDNRIYRIHYILGEIDENDFKRRIYINNKTKQKTIEILNIFELLSVVGIESFNHLMDIPIVHDRNEFNLELNKMVERFEGIRQLTNERFQEISKTYKHKVDQIKLDWAVTRDKF